MRLPEKGEFVRHIGRLVDIEEIQPPPQPPPKRDYIFESITAVCEIRFNGETIKELQTLNDFYGLETSVKSAIEEMKEFCTKKNIGPESDIEVVVVRVAEQCRFRPSKNENFYDKQFFYFNYLDYGSRRDLPDPVKTVVWSSKKGDQ